MTKVSVFGQPKKKKKKDLKKIELTHCMQSSSGNMSGGVYITSEQKELLLLRKGNIIIDGVKYDTIIASRGVEYNVFWGHWNDGVV